MCLKENELENDVCKTATVLHRSECDNFRSAVISVEMSIILYSATGATKIFSKSLSAKQIFGKICLT